MTPDDDVISRAQAVAELQEGNRRHESDQKLIERIIALPSAAPVVPSHAEISVKVDAWLEAQKGDWGMDAAGGLGAVEWNAYKTGAIDYAFASPVTQLTREGLNKTIKRLCAENSTDEFNAFGTFQNGMYALRDALLLAQEGSE